MKTTFEASGFDEEFQRWTSEAHPIFPGLAWRHEMRIAAYASGGQKPF